jgi:hypothetical protein
MHTVRFTEDGKTSVLLPALHAKGWQKVQTFHQASSVYDSTMSTLSSTSLLHNLPEAVTPVVFEALDPDSRKSLYAASGDVKALFSPAVSRLKIRLSNHQPDQQILAGLHPRVQPKRLTIRADYPPFEEGDESRESMGHRSAVRIVWNWPPASPPLPAAHTPTG